MTNTKIKTAPWSAVRKRAVKPGDEPLIAAEREILEAELRLAALRKHRKASQTTVASYVDALGGKLELVAVFDDERILI